MGVLARMILLTNSAPAFLEWKKHTGTHADRNRYHAAYSQLESVLLALP
jgi:hypothetical protein